MYEKSSFAAVGEAMVLASEGEREIALALAAFFSRTVMRAVNLFSRASNMHQSQNLPL